MHRRIGAFVGVAVVTAACTAPGRTPPAPPTSPDAVVQNFIQATYAHGVPYDKARALGPQAEPILLQLLDQAAMAPHRNNIVVTLGILGSTQAVERVIKVIETGTGSLPPHEVSLRMDAVMALGYAANADPNRTTLSLTYLLGGLEIPTWAPRVHWQLTDGANPASRLRDRSIGALGLSGHPEALRRLIALQSSSGRGGRGGAPPSAEQARLAEAISANQYIAANGMSESYETFLR